MPGQGRLGDKSHVDADGHGCKSCKHSCTGPAVQGSANVRVNHKPALKVGSAGVHKSCCGPNTWVATQGSSTVFINGSPAHREGDEAAHCGGTGHLVKGSKNVIVGGSPGAPANLKPPSKKNKAKSYDAKKDG